MTKEQALLAAARRVLQAKWEHLKVKPGHTAQVCHIHELAEAVRRYG